MDWTTEFDKKLKEITESHSMRAMRTDWPTINDASVFVHDTLNLCLASARTLFGEDVTPRVVFDIYDRVLEEIQSSQSQIE